MDNKAIALVLIALLVGLGGGYGLGYVIYQPQLQTIQNEMSGLHDELDNAEDRIRDLNSTLNGLQSSVSALNTELNTVDSDFASMQSQLTDLNTELNTINSALSGLESSITAFNTEFETINSAIGDLQSSVTDLNIIMDVLNATLMNFMLRSWHLVQAISGSTDTMTGTFQLRGQEIRIMWTALGLSASSWLDIALRFSNGTLYSYYGSSGIWTAINVEEKLGYFAMYYLDVTVYETDYVIAILDYY